MALFFFYSLFVISGSVFLEETDARDLNAFDIVGMDYIDKSIEDSPKEFLTIPTNNFNSIPYTLYTPSNPKEACFFEPTPEEFDYCPFDSSRKTILLIHGFAEELKPGNQFEVLKDTLLDHGEYNIIIVNWTLYNNFPFAIVFRNIRVVGDRVAETINFIINHKGADPQQFHCIGHSFGSHVCGVAARQIPNFHRVTGLDPGGLVNYLLLLGIQDILKPTDADYVDAIHTSVIETGVGLGLLIPVGDMDFYVNGGIFQRHCKFGAEYKTFMGDVGRIETPFDFALCNHFIVIPYFINSVKEDCEFIGTKCGSFVRAVLNPVIKLCRSNVTAKMGFHSKKIQGLPPHTAFYVDTLEFPPYCKN